MPAENNNQPRDARNFLIDPAASRWSQSAARFGARATFGSRVGVRALEPWMRAVVVTPGRMTRPATRATTPRFFPRAGRSHGTVVARASRATTSGTPRSSTPSARDSRRTGSCSWFPTSARATTSATRTSSRRSSASTTGRSGSPSSATTRARSYDTTRRRPWPTSTRDSTSGAVPPAQHEPPDPHPPILFEPALPVRRPFSTTRRWHPQNTGGCPLARVVVTIASSRSMNDAPRPPTHVIGSAAAWTWT